MPVDPNALSLTLHGSIHEIPALDWNACAGAGNPFVAHEFLAALEDSGSAGPRTGWLPRHVALRDASARVVAAAPAYVKSHSYGEYVFDHGWAQAFEQAGGRYYPKLQIASPFSPVPGPRLLCRPDGGITPDTLARALARVGAELKLSSVHATFCTEAEQAILAGCGWLPRLGVQYHWHNAGYANFDDFLGALSARKRKTIKRERRDANAAGLRFLTLRGADITPAHWRAFYKFYQATVDRKWGQAYLTAKFFPQMSERLGDRVVLMMAEHDGVPVAGALNLVGGEALYGRNWGCVGEWPFLHFELCYYRAIEFAIEHGLRRVEAGAQGEHKIQRGYLPSATYSAHWIANPGLRAAIKDFLDRERPAREQEMAELEEFSPYRKKEVLF